MFFFRHSKPPLTIPSFRTKRPLSASGTTEHSRRRSALSNFDRGQLWHDVFRNNSIDTANHPRVRTRGARGQWRARHAPAQVHRLVRVCGIRAYGPAAIAAIGETKREAAAIISSNRQRRTNWSIRLLEREM